MWSRLVGKEGRNHNPWICSLAHWRLSLGLVWILVEQETSNKQICLIFMAPSNIYTILHHFCSSFLKFCCKKKSKILANKSYKPKRSVITFNSILHDMTSIERYSRPATSKKWVLVFTKRHDARHKIIPQNGGQRDERKLHKKQALHNRLAFCDNLYCRFYVLWSVL